MFQVFEKPYGRRVYQTENQFISVGDIYSFTSGIFDEIGDHGCRMIADRNDDFVIGNNPDRYGRIGNVVVFYEDGDT